MKDSLNLGSIIDKANPTWLEELPCPVALSSRDRSFYLLNSAAKEIFRFSEEDLLSHPSLWAEQIHVDDRENFFKSQEELATRENVVRCDYRFFPKSVAEPIWIREASIIANRQPTIPWNVISVFMEITDLQIRHSTPQTPTKNLDILKPLFHDLQNRLQIVVMSLELANRGLAEMDSERLLQIVYSIKYSVENAQKSLSARKTQASYFTTSPRRGSQST